MNRRRRTHRGLTNTRIYAKRRKFYLFSPEAIENPKTGKVSKWHPLCPITDGEEKAREFAKAITDSNADQLAAGDMPVWVEKYRLATLKKREKKRPREEARIQLFEARNDEITRLCTVIKGAFENFDVAQVLPVDVATFVDQWEGKRMSEVYLSRLSDFFAWACRKGLRDDNPCREVSVESPDKRSRYITHAEFHAVRDALLIGENGRKTPSGPMVQCYVDLCYMIFQRTTEIRLLKWTDVGEHSIFFKPTKTESSSGIKVEVPISPAIRAVLNAAKELAKGDVISLYVIHSSDRKPYTPSGLRTAWTRACERAGVTNATLKDLRAKAMTDAKKAGYTIEQLKVAAAHTDGAMTEDYIKVRETAVSEVVLDLPPRSK